LAEALVVVLAVVLAAAWAEHLDYWLVEKLVEGTVDAKVARTAVHSERC
jgi:hypothetical protein